MSNYEAKWWVSVTYPLTIFILATSKSVTESKIYCIS